MITPIQTVHAVDAQGRYLGGFAGVTITELVELTRLVDAEEDTGLLDSSGAAIMRAVKIEEPYMAEQTTVIENLPAGAIVIEHPPEHGADILRPDGTWDTSQRPRSDR